MFQKKYALYFLFAGFYILFVFTFGSNDDLFTYVTVTFIITTLVIILNALGIIKPR